MRHVTDVAISVFSDLTPWTEDWCAGRGTFPSSTSWHRGLAFSVPDRAAQQTILPVVGFLNSDWAGQAANQAMSAMPPLATVSPKKAARREWDGPAALPPPTALRVPRGLVRRRSPVMSRTSSVHAVTTIGMDMGKNTLHMIGLDKRGAIVLREKVSRGRIASRLANLPSCWH